MDLKILLGFGVYPKIDLGEVITQTKKIIM
jgi:hypothetical protein